MVAPPLSYITQAKGEIMVVFSLFSIEVKSTQEEGG